MDVIESRRNTDPAIVTSTPPSREPTSRQNGAAATTKCTPQQFYEQVVQRSDIREILTRLAR